MSVGIGLRDRTHRRRFVIEIRAEESALGQAAAAGDDGGRQVHARLGAMRAEFVALPGLSLTVRQAMRLWSLDEESCRTHLEMLVSERFLFVSAEGIYRRATE